MSFCVLFMSSFLYAGCWGVGIEFAKWIFHFVQRQPVDITSCVAPALAPIVAVFSFLMQNCSLHKHINSIAIHCKPVTECRAEWCSWNAFLVNSCPSIWQFNREISSFPGKDTRLLKYFLISVYNMAYKYFSKFFVT